MPSKSLPNFEQRTQKELLASPDSESGDEQVSDVEIHPAFTLEELVCVKFLFSQAWIRFQTAKDLHFTNCAGKLFCSSFTMHCCSVDQHTEPWIGCYVNPSTSPSGSQQPGSCSVGRLCLQRKTRANQGAREMLSTPEHHDRVADVVFWNPTKEVYSIVGEVKGDPDEPADDQNTEQMVGLWKPHQKAMLGFIMKPNAVSL